MSQFTLKEIFAAFYPDKSIVSTEVVEAGHINDTYFVYTSDKFGYVLQRINHIIFTDVSGLMHNMQKVTDHIIDIHNSKNICTDNCVRVITTTDDKAYFIDTDGNYWRLNNLIADAHSYDKVECTTVALESGRIFGKFQNYLTEIDPNSLNITIENFLDLDTRWLDFQNAVKNNDIGRLENVQSLITEIQQMLPNIVNLENEAKVLNIPKRVTHNDTKINNVLFNKSNDDITVIDLDTIMPGFIHFDYSDAIRTVTNTGEEYEKDQSSIDMNFELFKAFTTGFITPIYNNLTDGEKQTLPKSTSLLAYLLCLRFMGDYINGDKYFKVKYPEHNLDRAKTQLALTKAILAKQDDIDLFFDELYKSCERT